jgi:hypothetical protein
MSTTTDKKKTVAAAKITEILWGANANAAMVPRAALFYFS